MINDIYNAKILEFAGNIERLGRLEAPTASAKAHSKLCGSTVVVDLLMDGDVVADFAQEVKACALGQASASIMARHIVGCTVADLKKVRDEAHAMLKEGAAAPAGKFEDFRYLEPVRDYKARHASTLLAFDAVVNALDKIEVEEKSEAVA